MKNGFYLGRPCKVVNYETAEGKKFSTRCENWDGQYLWQIYDRYSSEKQRVYDELWGIYMDDPKSSFFSIVGHNRFTFSVGWFSTLPEAPGEGLSREVSILVRPVPIKNHKEREKGKTMEAEIIMIVYPE